MEILGFQRVTVIDYPDRIASVLFVPGCNMRCPFCHNSDLVFRKYSNLAEYSEEEVLAKLEESKGFIEGVAITGGEPTLQPDIKAFLTKCKKLGLLVKLDTNGTNPDMLKDLVSSGIVDYVAMDIKAELEPQSYKRAIGVDSDMLFHKVTESANFLKGSGIEYEFRTTAVPGIVNPDSLVAIARTIKGAKAYYIQQFRPGNNLNPEYAKIKPHAPEDLLGARARILGEGLVGKCEVRGISQ